MRPRGGACVSFEFSAPGSAPSAGQVFKAQKPAFRVTEPAFSAFEFPYGLPPGSRRRCHRSGA